MSSEYLYTNPEHNEHITAMEIKTRLANIEDIIFHMNAQLKNIAEAQLELNTILAEMTQGMPAVTPEDEEGMLH